MTKATEHFVRALAVLLAAMLAALIAASGAALAVDKVCPPGTTQANPCSGTRGIDLLIGTSGPDFMKGLGGNDGISAGAGDDTTNGGGGSDTYSYTNGWGQDTLIDASGIDYLNFSAVSGDVSAYLVPEFDATGPYEVHGSNSLAEHIAFSGSTTIERVTGSHGNDYIQTGKEANTLKPGPGAGGAAFDDFGGFSGFISGSTVSIPVSSDTYTRFAASGYGPVSIRDFGGTVDKLVLPFASTDVYLEASSSDNDPAADDLLIMTSSTDHVFISGQLEPTGFQNSQKGHIEQIVFKDTTLHIGSETPQAQTLSGAATGSTERQVAELNEASNLDVAEKEKLSKAAKKVIEENNDNDAHLAPSDGGER